MADYHLIGHQPCVFAKAGLNNNDDDDDAIEED